MSLKYASLALNFGSEYAVSINNRSGILNFEPMNHSWLNELLAVVYLQFFMQVNAWKIDLNITWIKIWKHIFSVKVFVWNQHNNSLSLAAVLGASEKSSSPGLLTNFNSFDSSNSIGWSKLRFQSQIFIKIEISSSGILTPKNGIFSPPTNFACGYG